MNVWKKFESFSAVPSKLLLDNVKTVEVLRDGKPFSISIPQDFVICNGQTVNTTYKGYTLNKASKHESADKSAYYELKLENSTTKVTDKYSLSGTLISKEEKAKDTTK